VRAIVALCSLFVLIASAARAQDHQNWNEVDLDASWHHVAFVVPLVARLDTRAPHVPLWATGVTADVPLPWHLTLTGGYLVADLSTTRDHIVVQLPLVAASATWHVRRLLVADRHRIERLIGFGSAPVRYRQRLLLDLPLDAAARWHTFLSDEPIFDVSASRWSQNRLQVGAGPHLRSGVSIDLFYLQRTVFGNAPSTRGLGATVRIPLGRQA
jgi:Protein of unknown function (DUF2490)